MATLPRIGDVERVGALAGGEGALRRNLDAARSERTRAAYASAWRRFCAFAERDDMGTLPADPVIVGLYLSELGETAGPATVRLHAASIAAAHRDAGLEPPTAHPGVKQALRGHARRRCAPPEQVDALDQAAFEAISRTVGKRRASRGGHPETEAEHRERVAVDFALIGLMRDAMLRRAEVAAVTWGDITWTEDGAGVVFVARSKTDQEGAGASLYLSPWTMSALGRLREHREAPESAEAVIGLSTGHIARRIARMAREAGLKGRFSGHSPRVGMAQDLVRAGTGLPKLMQAGRWKSAAMPARYTEHLAARHGAVADFYRRQA